LVLGWAGAAEAAELRVDCRRQAGVIRPLHGVNCGPVNLGGTVDVSAYHKVLGIPFTRLHDCHWPNADVVDVHTIFPDFKADPNLPESYSFSRTDDYVQSILAVGSKIVYRLGESIEHTPKKYHVAPPADPEKWAAVCVGIVRHYNDGWAAGFHHDISYWEIWNEPENRPPMWTGSDEDYYRLYAATARAVKARFPGVRVGGPAVGYAGRLEGGALRPTPFLAGFLKRCRDESLPLDFFSWHRYTADPQTFREQAVAVRRLLDDHGFTETESHLNEWNYLPNNDWSPMLAAGQGKKRQEWYGQIGGPAGAAFTAYVLIDLQDSPVDVANYYTGEVQGFGLFSFHGVPKKTFYAMKAFKMLVDAPLRVAAEGGVPGRLAVAAGLAADKTSATVLISNFRSADERINLLVENLPWDGPAACEASVVDAERDLEPVRSETSPAGNLRLTFDLKAPAVLCVRLRKTP
jgi:hypothetical protein